MTQLTQKDLDVLGFYAGESNRELYWNYLAQKEGNDGYGLLALGVVRNDNAPGATANAFAARSAEQSSIQLTERQWDAVGRDLIEQDYSQRRRHFTVDRHLALNLPAKAVQDAHDAAFTLHKVPLNAWTPRELLENARTKAGEPESERIWRAMLDNEAFGLTRVGLTSRDVSRYAHSAADAGDYIARMTAARMEARDALPTTDPDAIRLAGIDYRRHADGQWRYDATTYAQAKACPKRSNATRGGWPNWRTRARCAWSRRRCARSSTRTTPTGTDPSRAARGCWPAGNRMRTRATRWRRTTPRMCAAMTPARVPACPPARSRAPHRSTPPIRAIRCIHATRYGPRPKRRCGGSTPRWVVPPMPPANA